MSSWREQRAEKERVEREREEALAAAKKAKLASLSAETTPSSSDVVRQKNNLFVLIISFYQSSHSMLASISTLILVKDACCLANLNSKKSI